MLEPVGIYQSGMGSIPLTAVASGHGMSVT
jgi:hypothetical protein